MTYYLQNRYQDSGWEALNDVNEPFTDPEKAKRRAAKLSLNSICYGMVRVVDAKGRPIITFKAGGGKTTNE